MARRPFRHCASDAGIGRRCSQMVIRAGHARFLSPPPRGSCAASPRRKRLSGLFTTLRLLSRPATLHIRLVARTAQPFLRCPSRPSRSSQLAGQAGLGNVRLNRSAPVGHSYRHAPVLHRQKELDFRPFGETRNPQVLTSIRPTRLT